MAACCAHTLDSIEEIPEQMATVETNQMSEQNNLLDTPEETASVEMNEMSDQTKLDITGCLKKMVEDGKNIALTSIRNLKDASKIKNQYWELRQMPGYIRRKMKEKGMKLDVMTDTAKKKIKLEISDINGNQKKNHEYVFQQSKRMAYLIKLFFSILTIVIFAYDIDTDISRAYIHGLNIYGCLTLLPVLFATIFNISLTVHCLEAFIQVSWVVNILVILIFITQTPTIVICIFGFINKCMKKRDFELDQKIITARYQESYFEAIPQLVLQLSIEMYDNSVSPQIWWYYPSDFNFIVGKYSMEY